MKTALVIALLFIGGCVACGVIFNAGPKSQTATGPTPEEKAKAADAVRLGQEAGLLVRIDGYDAWVNPSLWRTLDYNTKCNVTRYWAISANHTIFHVRDNMTGAELADYSEAWGTKIKN